MSYSVNAKASGILPLSIDASWKLLRDFTFPGKFFSTIAECAMEESVPATAVGYNRILKSVDGQIRKQRLVTLDDLKHRMTYELVESNVQQEASAMITTITCVPISESNQTLIIWETDFSADVPQSLVLFEQKSYIQNIKELREKMSSK